MSVNLSEEQFDRLLKTINGTRKGSMTSCSATYDGRKDRETVEAFLTAVQVFKSLEQVSESDALAGLPLLLRDEAAKWWQGVKDDISSWSQFEATLRKTFAPKKPEYVIYLEICGEKQGTDVLTDAFVMKKRLLFSELPRDEQLSEKQQIDITYGLLNLKIRDKVPRDKIKTFDELLTQARTVEALCKEKATEESSSTNSILSAPVAPPRTKKSRCNFCKKIGHVIDECRKRKKIQDIDVKPNVTLPQNVPPANQATFSCYGCGTPGVYRSNCKLCNNKPPPPPPESKSNLGFCAINIHEETRPRPMVFLNINSIKGRAYIDTCAKISVASYELYTLLKGQGQVFNEEMVSVTFADGVSRQQKVLTFDAKVELCGRTAKTAFVVLPDSRDNRTLLGIGFMQQTGMILNIAQFTWHFIEDPSKEYELYQENFISFEAKQVAFTPPRALITEIAPVSTMKFGVNPIEPKTMKRSESHVEATEAHSTVNTKKYKLIPIDLPALPHSRNRTEINQAFDGYSPHLDFIMNDAIMSIEDADNSLSPHSNALFLSSEDIGLCALDVSQNVLLNCQQQQELNEFLLNFEDVFVLKSKPVKGVEHCIDTGTHTPIAVPPYRMSPPRKSLLEKEIQKMLQEGVIVPCVSPWAAPVVLVPKPNNQIRVCVDYRRLNSITVPDSYPLPRIDDLLHEAKPTPFMTTLDLKSGYWQIKVRDADQDKTAFITPFGIFKFLRMPFGLRNAPSTFQRVIDQFRVSLGHVKILAYLDDLLIFSATFEGHMSDLKDVFQKLREYNFTVNREKCRFVCSTIKYLGHVITPEGLKVDQEKTKAILERPPPGNLKHLISFLQTCSWYRRFIKNFSNIAEPLTRLTKKNVSWNWKTEQQNAYQALKELLSSPPILKQADHTKPYIVKTDASNYALGAVLVQGEGELEHPIEYASRLLTKAERNYSTTEREALAVVWAISKFAGYIEGSRITILTDHQALRWLMTLKSPSGRLARWALQLQSHDITIRYVPGRINVVADTLSRPPCTENTQSDCGVCSVTVDMPTRAPGDIRREQLKDTNLAKIIKALESPDCDENAEYWSIKGYFTNDGLLYRHKPTSEDDNAQLVVPEQEWANILALYHDQPTAGHYGTEKTYQAIIKRYYWSGMRKYIDSYIRNCIKCQRYKSSNQKPAGLLQTHPLAQRFEVISFDLFGPLPTSPNMKNWVLIVEDLNSRWVELFDIEDATAQTCALILINEIFLRYGFPRRMVSDNGPQFVSAVMQQVSFCLKIKHGYTPVYHPEANPVERKNRDLKTQLSILLEGEHRNWPEHLPAIRFAMNTAVCKSTTYTPAYLTFGRELRTLDDTFNDYRKIVLSENFIPDITPKLMQLANTFERAKEVHEMEEEKRKELADKLRRPRPAYKPGDMVMVTLHPLSHASKGYSAKFAPKRDGPYLIKANHGPSSYEISSLDKPEEVLAIYHASALSPYSGLPQGLPKPAQPLKKRGRPRKEITNGTQTRRKPGRPKKH